jgi:hypothetical protein
MAISKPAAVAAGEKRWPIGSRWIHRSLGVVVVAEIQTWSSPPDAYCGEQHQSYPVIQDATGQLWSCYSPGYDLTSEPRP